MPIGESKLVKAEARNIKVGMLVKVHENEFFPCDMYVLNTSLKKGICFVETKNLDGETNLKHKQVDKNVMAMNASEDTFAT